MSKLIFLDIDGVLNHQEAYQNKQCTYNREEGYQTFAPTSKLLLNRLVKETGAEIVISSSWRADGLERLREIFALEGIEANIIGITPHFTISGYGPAPRGSEIESYLRSRGFCHINYSKEEQQKYIDASGIENYIILDDDGDMLYGQRNHFIHVLPAPRNTSGFNQKYYTQALKVLSLNILDINYE